MQIEHEGAVSAGLNPHYKPPIMRWNRVEIVTDEGVQCGIIVDDDGLLTVAVRLPGCEWPRGEIPSEASINTIAPGHCAYVVFNDDRGPARGHEFRPDPVAPDRCLDCPEVP